MEKANEQMAASMGNFVESLNCQEYQEIRQASKQFASSKMETDSKKEGEVNLSSKYNADEKSAEIHQELNELYELLEDVAHLELKVIVKESCDQLVTKFNQYVKQNKKLETNGDKLSSMLHQSIIERLQKSSKKD